MLEHDRFGIGRDEAHSIMQRIQNAAASFPDWLRYHGVSDKDMKIIEQLAPHAMEAVRTVALAGCQMDQVEAELSAADDDAELDHAEIGSDSPDFGM